MDVIAHRGASADYPELTATAFKQAFVQGADGVECDIRLTRCGSLVCIHDPVIERVSDGRGRVSALTLKELGAFNFGTEDRPEGPCSLAELLDILEDHPGKHVFIETKHPLRYGRMLEEELVKLLRYRGLEADPHIHLISFSGASINRISQLAPQLDRIYLRNEPNKWYHQVRETTVKPSGLGFSLRQARQLWIAQRLPAQPYVWTVDEPEDMADCLRHGVQWLATNRPALARAVIERSA